MILVRAFSFVSIVRLEETASMRLPSVQHITSSTEKTDTNLQHHRSSVDLQFGSRRRASPTGQSVAPSRLRETYRRCYGRDSLRSAPVYRVWIRTLRLVLSALEWCICEGHGLWPWAFAEATRLRNDTARSWWPLHCARCVEGNPQDFGLISQAPFIRR